ncbi:Ku protein [Streptomyces sp. TRM66268-LWL]|uniref:Non-homologous end joining protein Ku n=1 Tax=Streptomyces polyasparticus TaxID=2767826 RepID=A0ABR7S759_9ACTN|nr:Ku protein [Streptomyces polyasparticus]MBC9711322.1 Ku protein [Streptomyces polyasparticus]
MRSIWNGAISFGLVSIPIKLVNATENHNVSFRQIHTADGGRIRYRKVCELEEKEVTAQEIGKGYEDADGSIIPITDEDLASLPIPTAKTIEIVAFVPAERIDPLQMDTAYYLAANGVPAAKPYTLLREALKRSQKVAIAKFALRGRERLGMLRVVDNAIAMHGLLWPDEIRAADEVAPDTHVTVRDAELDLADALMETLGEVDIETLHDDYRIAVEEMIAAKTGGGAVAQAPAEPAGGGKVIDLMAALESSVRAAQAARGEGADEASEEGEVAEVTPLKSRKTAARKTESSKTASSRAASSRAASTKTDSSKTASSKRAPSRSAPAAPKAVGGKKSTAGAAKKAASGTTAKKTAKTTGAKKSSAKTAAAKKTTARKRASA